MKEPTIDWNDSSHEGSVARKKKMIKIITAIVVVLVIILLVYVIKKKSDEKRKDQNRAEAIQFLAGEDGPPLDPKLVNTAVKNLSTPVGDGTPPTQENLEAAFKRLAE